MSDKKIQVDNEATTPLDPGYGIVDGYTATGDNAGEIFGRENVGKNIVQKLKAIVDLNNVKTAISDVLKSR